jgi:hypothetical protein
MTGKSFYTKKLGSEVAQRARPLRSNRYHVISGATNNGWTVVPGGSIRSLKIFSTQRQAISFAKQTARRRNGEVIIHGKTGQVRNFISYEK